MQTELFDILISKYLKGTASNQERRIVESYLDKMAVQDQGLTEAQLSRSTAEIYQRLAGQIAASKAPVRKISFIKRFAVAAAILVLTGAGAWYFFSRPVSDNNITVAPSDILPGKTSATLTLADGREIILDSTTKGLLAIEGGININSDNGAINYEGRSSASDLYNTLTTRRGEQYRALKLSDGTRVWLNAGSSIKFPVAFNNEERRVMVSGEVYFEVAKDARKPFKVLLASDGEYEIAVLGTSFNVNSYPDEPSIKTTLIEGSVKVSVQRTSIQLSPGQQADLNNSNNLSLVENVNTDEVVAWKDGLFQFESADIRQVMRQLSRWYDIEVAFDADVPKRKFFASISRDIPLSGVLKILSASGINHRMEGKKLILMK